MKRDVGGCLATDLMWEQAGSGEQCGFTEREQEEKWVWGEREIRFEPGKFHVPVRNVSGFTQDAAVHLHGI